MKKVHNPVDAGSKIVHGPRMKFAKQLKALLSDLGISKVEAARIIGCTERSLYFWISGKRTPKPATREGILSRLNKRKAARR